MDIRHDSYDPFGPKNWGFPNGRNYVGSKPTPLSCETPFIIGHALLILALHRKYTAFKFATYLVELSTQFLTSRRASSFVRMKVLVIDVFLL